MNTEILYNHSVCSQVFLLSSIPILIIPFDKILLISDITIDVYKDYYQWNYFTGVCILPKKRKKKEEESRVGSFSNLNKEWKRSSYTSKMKIWTDYCALILHQRNTAASFLREFAHWFRNEAQKNERVGCARAEYSMSCDKIQRVWTVQVENVWENWSSYGYIGVSFT